MSVLPSVLLVVWLYGLLASGSLTGSPSLKTLLENNPVSQPFYGTAAVAAALALAVVTHPLQFALVQLAEGYWPNTKLLRGIRTTMVMRHLRRLNLADQNRRQAKYRRSLIPVPKSQDLNEHLAPKRLHEHIELAEEVVETQADLEAWSRIEAEYPENYLAVLPTRLGNALRKHELAAGAAIHLPVLRWATHIGMVADPSHTKYVNDQRTQVDLAVRVAASSFVAAGVTFAVLWQRGWMVLLALIPYAAGYLSYRGAVVAANGYGAALKAWVDLNRWRLYSQLGLPAPSDATAERSQNDALIGLLQGDQAFQANYRPQHSASDVSQAGDSVGPYAG